MKAIQNEIDAFQVNCDGIIQNSSTADMNDSISNRNIILSQSSIANALSREDRVLDGLRGDQLLKSSMKMQSEYIGRALLEVCKYRLYQCRSTKGIRQDFTVTLLLYVSSLLRILPL